MKLKQKVQRMHHHGPWMGVRARIRLSSPNTAKRALRDALARLAICTKVANGTILLYADVMAEGLRAIEHTNAQTSSARERVAALFDAANVDQRVKTIQPVVVDFVEETTRDEETRWTEEVRRYVFRVVDYVAVTDPAAPEKERELARATHTNPTALAGYVRGNNVEVIRHILRHVDPLHHCFDFVKLKAHRSNALTMMEPMERQVIAAMRTVQRALRTSVEEALVRFRNALDDVVEARMQVPTDVLTVLADEFLPPPGSTEPIVTETEETVEEEIAETDSESVHTDVASETDDTPDAK